MRRPRRDTVQATLRCGQPPTPARVSSPALPRRCPCPARAGGRGRPDAVRPHDPRIGDGDLRSRLPGEARPWPSGREVREHLPGHFLQVRLTPSRATPWSPAATTVAARSRSGSTCRESPRPAPRGHRGGRGCPRGFVLRSSSALAADRASSSTGGTLRGASSGMPPATTKGVRRRRGIRPPVDGAEEIAVTPGRGSVAGTIPSPTSFEIATVAPAALQRPQPRSGFEDASDPRHAPARSLPRA